MRDHTVELVYFDGCPHVEEARTNLRAATGATDEDGAWREWNLSDESTPERLRRFASPTVLVDGTDVTGVEGSDAGLACRTDGAPGVPSIRDALSR